MTTLVLNPWLEPPLPPPSDQRGGGPRRSGRVRQPTSRFEHSSARHTDSGTRRSGRSASASASVSTGASPALPSSDLLEVDEDDDEDEDELEHVESLAPTKSIHGGPKSKTKGSPKTDIPKDAMTNSHGNAANGANGTAKNHTETSSPPFSITREQSKTVFNGHAKPSVTASNPPPASPKGKRGCKVATTTIRPPPPNFTSTTRSPPNATSTRTTPPAPKANPPNTPKGKRRRPEPIESESEDEVIPISPPKKVASNKNKGKVAATRPEAGMRRASGPTMTSHLKSPTPPPSFPLSRNVADSDSDSDSDGEPAPVRTNPIRADTTYRPFVAETTAKPRPAAVPAKRPLRGAAAKLAAAEKSAAAAAAHALPHWQLKLCSLETPRSATPLALPHEEIPKQGVLSAYRHYELQFESGKITFSTAGRLGAIAQEGYEITPDMVRDVMYGHYRKVSGNLEEG